MGKLRLFVVTPENFERICSDEMIFVNHTSWMVEAMSKNYPITVAWFRGAKQAYKLLGETDEWKRYFGSADGEI